MADATNYATEANVIRVRLNGQIANVDIAWDGASFDHGTRAWIRPLIKPVPSAAVGIAPVGARLARHPGIVVVETFSPALSGDGAALAVADLVVARFSGVTVDGVRFGVPYVERAGVKDGWIHLNVVCPYQRDSVF